MKFDCPNPLMFLRIENEIPIVETEWGLANHFGDYIEIHKDLKQHPELYNAILTHELSHSTSAKFSWKDFELDFYRNPDINYSKLWKFMWPRKKTWFQLLPLYYRSDKGWIFDLNQTLIYLAIGLITIANIIIILAHIYLK